MIINLEITFLVNFIINSTLLYISSYLIGYKAKIKILFFSIIFSITSILILYINNSILYIISKTILILIFPLFIILSGRKKNIFTLIACFIIICGIAALIGQYINLNIISSLVISFVFILFAGIVPKIIFASKQYENIVNLKINNHNIKAFIDTGIFLPSTDFNEINIIIDKSTAKKVLVDEQYKNLLMTVNKIDFNTAASTDNTMSWIYVENILLIRKFKHTKLNSKIYLSSAKLPYDALISSLNI